MKRLFILTLAVLIVAAVSFEVGAADKYEQYVASLPAGYQPVPMDCFKQAMKEGQVNIYDWAEWWPEEMYENYSREFGIKIVRDNYASYDELVTKYRLNPKAGYDFLLPDPVAFKQLQALGVVLELNHNWIPNVNKYLNEGIKKLQFDPGYKHGVLTYTSLNGYAIDTKYVDENDPRHGSWAFIFDAPGDLKDHGRLVLKDNMFQVIGTALKYLGYSYNSDNERELAKAKELLLKVKPWVLAYDGWPKRMILEQETWVTAPFSTGDYLKLADDVPTLKVFLAKEGTVMRGALMTIPKSAPHPAAAHLWLNFVFRPDVNLALCGRTGRIPTHTEVGDKLPEKVRKWPGVETPPGYMDKCELPGPSSYTGKGLEIRAAIWEDLKR